jgi:hypothetical protein
MATFDGIPRARARFVRPVPSQTRPVVLAQCQLNLRKFVLKTTAQLAQRARVLWDNIRDRVGDQPARLRARHRAHEQCYRRECAAGEDCIIGGPKVLQEVFSGQ